MFRGLLARLTAHIKQHSAADDEEGENSRFIPSVLDFSVRYSHGGSNPGGDREIAQIQEEAQRLSEYHRKK